MSHRDTVCLLGDCGRRLGAVLTTPRPTPRTGVPAVRITTPGTREFLKGAAVKQDSHQFLGHNQMLQAINPTYFFERRS